MKENLDLVEILKDCPNGTKLYSPLFGEVLLESVSDDGDDYPILVSSLRTENRAEFKANGLYEDEPDGECMLYPSRNCRDWSQFKQQQQQFKPYDKVIVCDGVDDNWMCSLYSHCDIGNKKYKHITLNGCYVYCLPFEGNEHLLGQQFSEEHLK